MKILNFGSLNLDYVYSVPHFVRPGETVLSYRRQTFCGGKGLNQSIAIARAGAKVWHAGKVGHLGEDLIGCLEEAGVDTSLVLVDQSEETGHTIIQVDPSGQNCILLYGGTNQQITLEEVDAAFCHCSAGDLLLLQNEINNIPDILEKAHNIGLQVALNPSPITKELLDYPLQYVKWFILNEIEGNEMTGKTDPADIAETLLYRYPRSAIVLTLGKKGVYYRDSVCTTRHGTYRVDRVDTTAAGDTFTGYFLSGIVKNLEIGENLRQASVASSLAVSRPGASPSIPLLNEVLHAALEPVNS